MMLLDEGLKDWNIDLFVPISAQRSSNALGKVLTSKLK